MFTILVNEDEIMQLNDHEDFTRHKYLVIVRIKPSVVRSGFKHSRLYLCLIHSHKNSEDNLMILSLNVIVIEP